MLDVSRIVFHLLCLDHELLLLLLRVDDFTFEVFLLPLQPVCFLQDGHKKKHKAREKDDARDHLRDVDKVAYIRFASVYREFKDVGEILTCLEELGVDGE